MPDIGDVYYLSNAIFFDFDGNPLVIIGPPDHYLLFMTSLVGFASQKS